VKARLELLLRRLGVAGIAGVGVLLACAAFYFSTLAPLEADATAHPPLGLGRAGAEPGRREARAPDPDERELRRDVRGVVPAGADRVTAARRRVGEARFDMVAGRRG